jgi:hypothetical protein
MKQRPEFFSNFGWPDYLFYLQKLIWPELSKQCYNLSCTVCRMNFLSNILTWLILPGPLRIKLFAYILTSGGQIIYFIYKNCWFFIFFSDNSKCFHRNGFEMYILIIIYTVCTCDTLVPTRILNSEISWFCWNHQCKQVSTCIILVLKEVKFLAFLALQRNYFMYVLP